MGRIYWLMRQRTGMGDHAARFYAQRAQSLLHELGCPTIEAFLSEKLEVWLRDGRLLWTDRRSLVILYQLAREDVQGRA